jgi:hypothetical protein
MKTQIHNRAKRQQGNTWLTTIMITGLIGFILAVYLTLVQSQSTATFRSQAWNMAMPVVEAGIEDALAHINANYEIGLERDGWSKSGDIYSLGRPIGDSIYRVHITNYFFGIATNGGPIVTSYGYVSLPGATAPAHGTLLATVGGFEATLPYLGRGVRVRTVPDFIFTRGMVAKDSIDLNGNNIRTDSFDSQDPRYSTNGMYRPGTARDHGDIAVNNNITNSINAGNADIWGSVATGPGGTIALGPGGIVGDTAWHNGGNTGVQTGHSKSDMNVSFPDAKVPFTGGRIPTGGWLTNVTTTFSTNQTVTTVIPYPSSAPGPVVTNYPIVSVSYPIGSPGPITTNWSKNQKSIISYEYPTFSWSLTNILTTVTTNAVYYDCLITEAGDYKTGSLVGKVYVGANARMYVTTTLNFTDLFIYPGCWFRLYTSATSASLGGNESANSTGTADNFSFYGLPECTSITYGGNATLIGTIYAPNADFILNGGGNNRIDYVGASITKTARLNGHFNFHYDEALGRSGPFRGFIIDQWFELTAVSVPRLTTGDMQSGH